MARRGYTAMLRQQKLLTVDAFRVQVENGLENFFSCISLASIQICDLWSGHTGDYVFIQVKHWRDINLKLSFYF